LTQGKFTGGFVYFTFNPIDLGKNVVYQCLFTAKAGKIKAIIWKSGGIVNANE